MPLNLPNKRRANESKFSQFHDEIFALLALGYSQTSILEQLKNSNPNLQDKLNINSLKGYILRQKKNPKSRYNILKGETVLDVNRHSLTKEESNPIQIEAKNIEHVSTSQFNFSSIESSTDNKKKKLDFRERLKKFSTNKPPEIDEF